MVVGLSKEQMQSIVHTLISVQWDTFAGRGNALSTNHSLQRETVVRMLSQVNWIRQEDGETRPIGEGLSTR